MRKYEQTHGYHNNFLILQLISSLQSPSRPLRMMGNLMENKKKPHFFCMVLLSILRGLPLACQSTVIPKASTIWIRNSSDPIGLPLKVTKLLNCYNYAPGICASSFKKLF